MTTSTGSIPTTDILGINISALNMQTAAETIEGWINGREQHYVCICTVNSVMETTRDPAYRELMNNAGLRTPDGMPLVWLSKRAGHADVERVCGPDLLPEMAKRSTVTGHRHYFYGGAPGVAEQLAHNLSAQHPGMTVAGTHTPGMLSVGESESDEVISRINDAHPDIVWVGLGTPKQDWWAANHLEFLSAPVVIAVGAAFDFHSGRIKRAPRWMQKSGTEWLFRLSQDPKRLWKRYTVDNAAFTLEMINSELVSLMRQKRDNGR